MCFFDRIQLRQFSLFSVLFLILLLFLLIESTHSAQVTLTWDPETDPDVAGYRIHYGLLSNQYTGSVDVGNQTSYTVANLSDGKTYYFAATAYDRYGDESGLSDEVVFDAPLPCAYSVSLPSRSFAPDGGSETVSVTTQSECSWTAVSNASWLVVTSNSNRSGNGTVNYSALSNTSGFSRTGTLTVAGQSVTVTQGGLPSYTLTASAGSNGAISPQGTLTVPFGTSETFTIKATESFQVADVKVDGVSQGSLTTYTFNDVSSNHTITATFGRRIVRK